MYVFYSISGVITGAAHATGFFEKEHDKGKQVGDNIEELLSELNWIDLSAEILTETSFNDN